MDQNSEEEKIKRLFRQLRRADERLAPPFASLYHAASSEIRSAGRRSPILRLAVASITLVLLGVSAYVFFKRPTNPLALQVTSATEPSESLPTLSRHAPSQVELPVKSSPKRARRAPLPGSRPPVAAITEWRSPTNFLLTTAGDEWLMSVPRLDESIVRIKPVAPEN